MGNLSGNVEGVIFWLFVERYSAHALWSRRARSPAARGSAPAVVRPGGQADVAEHVLEELVAAKYLTSCSEPAPACVLGYLDWDQVDDKPNSDVS